jgi:protein-S-isoprenylcysteine O-methyltransferase
MRLPDPGILGAIYGLSELGLSIARRSGSRDASRDRHSLAILWGAILISIGLAIATAWLYPAGALPHRRLFYFVGLALFTVGLMLRWYSIIRLGRFFTVDVSIAEKHRLIDTGPYRFIRHPSYTGALIAFLGFGFCLGNWLSILFLTLPTLAAFCWRIRVEEQALIDALGDEYRAYMRRTKRLIPFIY